MEDKKEMILNVLGTDVTFKFGIGFIRTVDEHAEGNEGKFGFGLDLLLPSLLTGSPVTLQKALQYAQVGGKKISQAQWDEYFDSEDFDFQSVLKEVTSEIEKGNLTSQKVKKSKETLGDALDVL